MLVDFGVYSKYNIKYLFWLKTNQLYELKRISIVFNLKKLDDEEDSRILGCFYLFRYFFGISASVIKEKRIFLLGKNYADFIIGFSATRKKIYFPLYFWIYEIQSCINIEIARDYCLTKDLLTSVLWDVNIFNEKKTNSALFDLKDPLHFSLFLNKGLISNKLILLSSLKFIC